MDFTLKTYQNLIEALIKQGYCFQSFGEYIEKLPLLPSTSRIKFGTGSKGESRHTGSKMRFCFKNIYTQTIK